MPSPALRAVVHDNAIRFLGHDEHAHDEPHLVYVAAGSATVAVDGVPARLATGEAFWLAAGVPHAVTIDDGGLVLGPVLEHRHAPPVRAARLVRAPALVELMTTLLGAAPSAPDEVAPFRRAIGELLVGIGAPAFPAPLPSHPAARAVAVAAAAGRAPLGELAAARRISVRQVQRVFEAETGMSFATWRRRVRLNAAVSALRGGASEPAAASAGGYASRAGLLRALAAETGRTAAQVAADPLAAADAPPVAGSWHTCA